jgi:phosphomannomutase/phosphoglucomutase
MVRIDPHIFRAYDVRGKAGSQLTEEACFLIGHAYGSEIRERFQIAHPTVCVGRDARLHSLGFEEAVVKGLMKSGCHVQRIGLTPSPVNYFTICTQKLDGGVQVTASHNPPEDNGLKLSMRDADAFAGDDIQLLRQRIEDGRMLDGEGTVEEFDAMAPYLRHVTTLFAGAGKNLSVVVDGGNGVGGPSACQALRSIGATVTELYTEPDGRFPNHPADPSKHATLKDLQKKVVEMKADIGLAFDGDADRLGIVDETGTIRTADEILLLLAKDHLTRHPGAPVIFTVSNSGMLLSEIQASGGTPVMSKVGHAFVEHAMREHGAKLGGEQSGHFFSGEDYFGFDDALVAGLRILSILQQTDTPLSQLFAKFPKVFQSAERRPFCPDDRKAQIIDEVTRDFIRRAYSVDTLDGARIDFGEGAWAGIRKSNTSPCLSVCIEARSPEKLKEVEQTVLASLQQFPEIRW